MRMLSPLPKQWSTPRRTLSPSFMVSDLFEDFDRITDSWMRPSYSNNSVDFLPTCDINETKQHYLVSFDMPGVKKEDVKIEVQGNTISISGERHRDIKDTNDESVIRFERSYGKFQRTFELPVSINADKIEAHYDNGVLNIALPKAEANKGRTVQIQTGENALFNKLAAGTQKDGIKENVESKDVKIK